MNRLEFAKKMVQQPVATCPFLSAIDIQTRATLLEQHPDPHALPEAQLLELATQHGYNTPPHQIPLKEGERREAAGGVAPRPQQPLLEKRFLNPTTPTHTKNHAHLETDFFDFDFSNPRPTGRTHGSPLQQTGDDA